MANQKQASARRAKMADRAAALMEIHFPGTPLAWLWGRKTNHGFTTVPRTLPIAMQAVDLRSKGQPPGHTLFCLWARAPDHPFIVVENPATFAAEAGFSGGRAVDTWRRRIKFLVEYGFLLAKPGPSGSYHYLLLLNPNAAVERMRRMGQVQDELYGRFRDRIADIGASADLDAVNQFWADQTAAALAQEAAAAAAVVEKVAESE